MIYISHVGGTVQIFQNSIASIINFPDRLFSDMKIYFYLVKCPSSLSYFIKLVEGKQGGSKNPETGT